ncbi:BnaC01g27200D [Brassica napus]|uniref:BnaC01g27200D protein n=2 Tax=Brassica TaxID=3705 RepID=A0A078HQD7_BRANA|nr:BnaC01g27200D [Brassica napus]VDD51083.1 unnamed protein product [Brassica oleracea]
MFSIWILVDDNPRSEPLSDHVRSLVCRLCGGTVDWPSFSRPRLLDALGVLLNVYQELIPRLGPLPISWLGLKKLWTIWFSIMRQGSMREVQRMQIIRVWKGFPLIFRQLRTVRITLL